MDVREHHVNVLPTPRHVHAAQVLAAVEGHYLALMFEIALVFGLRPIELRGLLATDADRLTHQITIQHDLYWGRNKIPHLHGVKSEAGHRTLLLPESLWARFEALLDTPRQPVLVLEEMREWREVDPVFRRTTGAPLRGDGTGGVNDLFKRCLKRAGLETHRLYELRHLAVGVMLQDMAPDEVAQLVGQSGHRLTLDTYRPEMEETKHAGANHVEALYNRLRELAANSGPAEPALAAREETIGDASHLRLRDGPAKPTPSVSAAPRARRHRYVVTPSGRTGQVSRGRPRVTGEELSERASGAAANSVASSPEPRPPSLSLSQATVRQHDHSP
jgi:hypothetical protein